MVYNHITGVPMLTNINPRSNGTTGVRPLAQFNRIDQLQNIGENNYKALLVRFDKRLERNYQVLVSYSLAKGEGNIPFTGNNGRVTDSQNPGLDWGPTAGDRRHVLVASGSYLLPAGVQVGAVWTVRTSMPFNAVAGAGLNGDGVVSDFVPGTTRAMGNRDNAEMLTAVKLSGHAQPGADFRVTDRPRRLQRRRHAREQVVLARWPQRVELIAQVFNLLGRDNLAASGGGGGQAGVGAGLGSQCAL